MHNLRVKSSLKFLEQRVLSSKAKIARQHKLRKVLIYLSRNIHVQRTSVSFFAQRLGFSLNDSRTSPSLIYLFSLRVLRWFGTSIKLASTILPSFTIRFNRSNSSKNRLKSGSVKSKSIRRSLKCQTVLLSGSTSAMVKFKKTQNLIQSLI